MPSCFIWLCTAGAIDFVYVVQTVVAISTPDSSNQGVKLHPFATAECVCWLVGWDSVGARLVREEAFNFGARTTRRKRRFREGDKCTNAVNTTRILLASCFFLLH